ncbi:MAG: DNA-3-methyladenine glycosylase [Flavobacteriales bacterium]|nr:DNA-3-methyladenine glycosylase [Flavobacteriales bacterium]
MRPRALPRSFYTRTSVTDIARELLGMVIVTSMDGTRTTGIITETEAYAGVNDRASHAHGGRRTARTEVMYSEGGTAYVYLCYGIHHLFNLVTNEAGVPHAVLVRGIVPDEGIERIMERRLGRRTTGGPGTAAQALGIHVRHSGTDLIAGPIRIEDHGHRVMDADVRIGARIGVDYAGADAKLPYRFWVRRPDALLSR